MNIEEIRKNVRGILGLEPVLKEEQDDSVDSDLDIDLGDNQEEAPTDDNQEVTPDEETADLGGDEETDQNATSDNGELDSSADEENAAGESNLADTRDDATKVKEMFTDTGDVHEDYSLSNENNKRLSKFRFTYAGLNIDDLMTNEEKTLGVSADELYARLSPDQQEECLRKWKKLRNKFPEIEKREKKILIHNANIMIYKNNEEGRQIELPENLRKKAYEKIEALLTTIKINFDDENPVKPNFLSIDNFNDISKAGKISFNKMFVESPSSIKTFLRNNKENEYFNRSPIFQSLISDYREKDTSTGTLAPILYGTQPPTEVPEESAAEEGAGDEGSLGGRGDMGGGDGGGDVNVDVDTTVEEPLDLNAGGGEDQADTGNVDTNQETPDIEL